MMLVRAPRWVTFLLFLFFGVPLKAQDFYKASVVSLVATNIADVVSSQGRYERNPVLRGADGRFSMRRGVPLKIIVVGGTLLIERIVPRKVRTRLNFSLSAITSGVVVYNLKGRKDK